MMWRAISEDDAWPSAQALTSWAKSLTRPSLDAEIDVTVEPHRRECALALASGDASRPSRGMSAASSRMRGVVDFVQHRSHDARGWSTASSLLYRSAEPAKKRVGRTFRRQRRRTAKRAMMDDIVSTRRRRRRLRQAEPRRGRGGGPHADRLGRRRSRARRAASTRRGASSRPTRSCSPAIREDAGEALSRVFEDVEGYHGHRPRARHSVRLALRAPHRAVLRQGAYRLLPARRRRRPVEARAHRRHVRAPPADPGGAVRADRRGDRRRARTRAASR